MKQKDIMALLKEAAEPRCALKRRKAILADLQKEVFGPSNDSRRLGLDIILGAAFKTTLEAKPDHLVSLFPVFALLCGDRQENEVVASEVDFSLLC